MSGEIEVVFREGSEDDTPDKEKWKNLLAAPLVFAGIIPYSIFLRAMKVIFDSDSAVAMDITQKYDIEEIFVDRPVHQIWTEERKPWTVSNYTLIFIPALTILSGSPSGGGVIFIMITVAMATAFVAGTSSSRNMAMATEVMKVASNSEYDTGVLMVEQAHKEPIQRILETETDEVEVVN